MEKKGVVGASSPQWISVKDRLPDQSQNVLVFLDDARVPPEEAIGVDFIGGDGMWFWNHPFNITHWMPPPEPPRG